MSTKVFLVGGLFLAFSACASTNNGGHVVGNPIISEGASKKMAAPADEAPSTCDCPKDKKDCKCKKGDSKSCSGEGCKK